MTEDTSLLTDESLMLRVHSHDHQAFSILVERYSRKFYMTSYNIVMHQHAAEDIVQDAFLKIWDNPKIWKKNKGAKFTTWFYRIVINLSTDYYRKNKKNYTINEEADLFKIPANQLKNFYENEQQEALDNAVKKLPEKQLLALNLCFYEGVNRKEAAKIMKLNIKALESLLIRAKQAIKDDLYRTGFLEESEKEKQA